MIRWVLCSTLVLWAGAAFGQAPPNDTCASAIEFVCGETVNIEVNTSLANNDYELPPGNLCTGFSSGGPDIVYRIVIPNGGSVDFTLDTLPPNGSGYDGSLYLITNCADPTGSCLAGSDGCNVPNGEIEQFSYTNSSGGPQTTFLIVDGFAEPGGCGADRGTALLTGTVTCPAVAGACCRTDGTCSILSQSECQAAGGTYLGDGTDCDPNPCAAPTGACCQPGGACSITTEAQCTDQGGFYVGDGTDCDPNPCVTPVEPSTWGRIKSTYGK